MSDTPPEDQEKQDKDTNRRTPVEGSFSGGFLGGLGEMLSRLDELLEAADEISGERDFQSKGGNVSGRVGWTVRTLDSAMPSSMPQRSRTPRPTSPASGRTPSPRESARRQPETSDETGYKDIGGLDRELQRIREMVELPMRYPQVFRHLGITPPRGVLLYGPPGSGKTLIARSLARETSAHFTVVNGPEIIDKFYGQSEGALRRVFEDAQANAPAIIFIDEIDSIAPHRSRVQGEVEKRVVAQLLTLMDGLDDRGDVVVIGATNLPNQIDPALRRPGRFDREIHIPVPNRQGRLEILLVHTQGMPLNDEVNLDYLADITHGFVGADLQALCREAAMAAFRRLLNTVNMAQPEMTLDDLLNLTVTAQDWEAALREVTPNITREVLAEIPDVSWGDIGGLERVKAALQQAIEWPLRHAAVFAQARLAAPKGILLSGPPGTGKTLLAKAIARQVQVNFISVRGPELLNKYVGESERAVREIFEKAHQAAPCILFFDEFDSIAAVRGGEDRVSERVVAQLLTEMDGMLDHHGVMVLASTNRPELIDPALRRPGRLDLHIEIPLPTAPEREAIFRVHLRQRPVNTGLDLPALVQHSEGWSGAEIAEWCRRATLHAVSRTITEGTPLEILPEDFEAEQHLKA